MEIASAIPKAVRPKLTIADSETCCACSRIIHSPRSAKYYAAYMQRRQEENSFGAILSTPQVSSAISLVLAVVVAQQHGTPKAYKMLQLAAEAVAHT